MITRKRVVSTSNSMIWLNMSNSFNICAFSPHEVIEQCTGFEEDVICEVIYRMRDRVFFRMHVHNLQNFVRCLKVFLKQRSTTWGNPREFAFSRNN